MANVGYISGLNYEDGNSILLCVYGNDVAKFSGGSWVGQAQNLIPGNYQISMGKGYAYLTGINVNPRVINSSGTWSQTTNLTKAPKADYNRLVGDRHYFGYCSLNSNNYYRRIFYTDIIEQDDAVTWGIEYGSDLVQTAGDATITSAGSSFIDRKIKIGDPVFILDGNNAGTYAVSSVIDNTNIELTKALTYSGSSTSFWIGGNWFDLPGKVTGIGEHYGTPIGFEANSAWRYSTSIGRKQIIGVKGTLSYKSIVSNHRGYSFWYHPTDGIVAFNGSVAKTISNKIEPILKGMSSSMYSSVVGWPGTGIYKDHLYMFIGNSTFNVNGESFTLTNCIVDYNIARNKWKVFEYNAVITSATVFQESNVDNVYIGTSSDLVLQFDSGNSDYDVTTDDDATTLDIHSYIITHPVYPSGIEVMNEFDKYFSWKDIGNSIKSRYRLHGNIDKNDSEWSPLNELNDDYSEVKINPQKCNARGISFMIDEISKTPSFEFLGFSFIYSVVGEAYRDELP